MDSDPELFSDLAKTANGIALIALLSGLALSVGRRTRRLGGSTVTVAALTWAAVLCVTAGALLGTRGRWWELAAGLAVGFLLHVAIHRGSRSSAGSGVLAVLLGLPLVAVLDALLRGERGLESGRLFLPLIVVVIAAFALGGLITRRGLDAQLALIKK